MTTVVNPANKLDSLHTNWDGSLLVAGATQNAIPDSESREDLAKQWDNFSGVNFAGGDFVTSVSGLNGQNIVALSGNPLTTGESYVVNTNKGVYQPCSVEFAGSFVRPGGSFATASLFANGPAGADPVPAPIAITSYYQSSALPGVAYNAAAGTILQLLLATPLPAAGANNAVYVGDWVNIEVPVDNRLSYFNACISYISPSRSDIALGFSDEAALPSLAIPVTAGGGAKVRFYNNLSGARNGFGLRFTGTSATSAAIVSIFGGDDNQISGNLVGDHRVTIGTTAPTYVAGAQWGQYEIRASTRFMLEAGLVASVVYDKAEQSSTFWVNRDSPRTSVKPSSEAKLFPRFRLFKPSTLSRPVADIVSAVKASASSTATVTTRQDHTLVTGNWVTLKGGRDITNFAPVTTPVQVTVTGLRTFTVTWGTAVASTTYGGSVILANGNRDQPGIIGQTVQSVESIPAAGGNWLRVIGSATWAGMNMGDYVNLHGVASAVDGTHLGLDGAWEVAHLTNPATSTMILRPVTDIAGNRVSPALGTLALTNAGGTVILRPTLRSHDLSVKSWAETSVGIVGQGTTRADLALPISVVGQPTVNVNPAQLVGSNVAESAAATANPLIVGGVVRTALVAADLVAGDAARATMTAGAAAVVKPYAVPEATWSASLALTTATAQAVQAAVASYRRNITALQAINTGAAVVDLILLDGVTERWRLPLPINVPVSVEFPTELLATVNTVLNVNLSAVGTVRFNAQGYTAP